MELPSVLTFISSGYDNGLATKKFLIVPRFFSGQFNGKVNC